MNEWEQKKPDILNFVSSLNDIVPGKKAGCTAGAGLAAAGAGWAAGGGAALRCGEGMIRIEIFFLE